MPKRDYHLTSDEHAAVSHAMIHHVEVEVRLGCQALLALHDGLGPTAVTALCGVTRRTVYRWQERYVQRRCIEDLKHIAPTGRPRKITDAYIAELEQALAAAPSDYGYDFAVWTVERLIAHLAARTNIVLSTRSVEALLAHLGYVYRRPKASVKHLQDPAAVAQAQENWAALKRGPKAQTTPTGTMSSSPWTKPP